MIIVVSNLFNFSYELICLFIYLLLLLLLLLLLSMLILANKDPTPTQVVSKFSHSSTSLKSQAHHSGAGKYGVNLI